MRRRAHTAVLPFLQGRKSGRAGLAATAVLLGFGLLVACGACRSRRTVQPAFFYWKTSYRLERAETEAVQRTGARRLYLRLCDVGWNASTRRIEPHDALHLADSLPDGVEPIPVIFLETAALPHLDQPVLVDDLAKNMAAYVRVVCTNAGWSVREVQLDCDWTASTGPVYFALLHALKRRPFLAGKTLSVTVRLHQVKDIARAGVPPADRGMLMCYNLGSAKNPEARNSILDVAEAKTYLKNLGAYPLPLDLALPIFRWCLWYRGGRLVGILRDVEPDDCDHLPFLQRERGTVFRCIRDASWGGYPLRAGDRIRAESPAPDAVEAIAAYAARRLKNDSCTVAFYHLDQRLLKNFPPHALERILDRCR